MEGIFSWYYNTLASSHHWGMCRMHHVQISVCVFLVVVFVVLWENWGSSKIPPRKISSERWPDLLLLNLSVFTPGQKQQKCGFVSLWITSVTGQDCFSLWVAHSTQQKHLWRWSRCCLSWFAEKSQGWLNGVICKAAVFDCSHSIAYHFGVGEKGLNSLGDYIHLLLCIPSNS